MLTPTQALDELPTYTSVSENYRGLCFPNYQMPPKRCEKVGCQAHATCVAEAQQGNWYLCDQCGAADGVKAVIRLNIAPALDQ
mgnify:CR=1 FL=1